MALVSVLEKEGWKWGERERGWIRSRWLCQCHMTSLLVHVTWMAFHYSDVGCCSTMKDFTGQTLLLFNLLFNLLREQTETLYALPVFPTILICCKDSNKWTIVYIYIYCTLFSPALLPSRPFWDIYLSLYFSLSGWQSHQDHSQMDQLTTSTRLNALGSLKDSEYHCVKCMFHYVKHMSVYVFFFFLSQMFSHLHLYVLFTRCFCSKQHMN